jgi:hypothetical protein
MTAATVDYLTTLPWFAVSDPDEPTPIHDALKAEQPCWCGSAGDEPCRTKSGRALGTSHKGRGQ